MCVGLVHLAQSELAGPVVIMDADGEDAPSDITRLLGKFVGEDERKMIFAARDEGFAISAAIAAKRGAALP